MADPISIPHAVSTALITNQALSQTSKWNKPLSANPLNQTGHLLNHSPVAKVANKTTDKVAASSNNTDEAKQKHYEDLLAKWLITQHINMFNESNRCLESYKEMFMDTDEDTSY